MSWGAHMAGIADILYVRFQVPDLDRQRRFLDDFGLITRRENGTLLARGTDANAFIYSAVQGEAAFLGIGFEALSEEDLRRIAAIDGAAVEANDAPGGGLIARLEDPDGLPVDLVYGMERPAAIAPPSRQPLNLGEERRRLGERVAYKQAPGFVKRLGHCVINVTDFRASEAWYKERLGLLTSDEIYMGQEDRVLGAFLRCNRGERHVDHHSLFLIGSGKLEFQHAAFEVADWDSLMLGHDLLRKAGYKHSWGVGKHILGSQVFDYWKDPNDFTVEHFTDGDLFNESFGAHKAPVEQLLGSHWGPEAKGPP